MTILLGKANHGGEAASDLLPQLASGDPASATAYGTAASVRVGVLSYDAFVVVGTTLPEKLTFSI